MRNIAIIALVAVIGFSMSACGGGSGGGGGGGGGDDDDGGGGSTGGGGGGAGVWLWVHHKDYTVTDGVVGNVNYEYDITYTSYTDDKHYARQYSYTTPTNTSTETTQYTQTQVGSSQTSVNDSRDGNTSQYTLHTISDSTTTITYKDSSNSSSNRTTRTTNDTTQTRTYVYDNDSGLEKSHSIQTTYKITRTVTQGGTQQQPTETTTNGSQQYTYTIELLSTEGSIKTYKSNVSSYIYDGESQDISTQGYTVYKVQNGITLEEKSYTAAGVLSSTYTYSFPNNAVIRSKLPDLTLYNRTLYGSNGSSSTAYSTVEVLSDSNTELRIQRKWYDGGTLSTQFEHTYRRR